MINIIVDGHIPVKFLGNVVSNTRPAGKGFVY